MLASRACNCSSCTALPMISRRWQSFWPRTKGASSTAKSFIAMPATGSGDGAAEARYDVTKVPRRQIVQAAAAKLRDLILAREPGTQVGSLNEVAQSLGVGILTVQQAARLLDHEGLLAVRRGPGGGYYRTRPDEAALEPAFAAYLPVHAFGQLA